MRIGLLAPLWHPICADTQGGVEQIVYLLAKELVRRQHHVILIASGDSEPIGRLTAPCDECVVRGMEAGRMTEYIAYERAAVREAIDISSQVDIVHDHTNGSLLPFAPILAAPVLYTIHFALAPDLMWLLRKYPPLNISCVGQHQVAQLRQVANATAVWNGIDPEAFPLCTAPKDYLLFLGRLEPAKGVHVAIEIAKALSRPLILAGPRVNSGYFDQYIAPALSNPPIHWVGPVSGGYKLQLLREAHALLFPVQWDEPFGLVLIEAMACGTPVLALKRGDVEKIIVQGVGGFFADTPAELISFSEKVSDLDRARVRETVVNRFSYQRMADQYLQLYDRILQVR